MAIETVFTFLLTSGLLALAPGPDNFFVLTQSMLYGRWAGFYITLGLCSGLVFHTTAVALGVATLFQYPPAYLGLKVFGALYLLYIAWQTVRTNPMQIANSTAAPLTILALYRRGIIMNISNPKVAIFFLAFLPQFAQSQSDSLALQLFQLGGMFMLVTLVIFSGVALLAGSLGEWIKTRPRIQKTLNTMVAIILCGLALRLLIVQ